MDDTPEELRESLRMMLKDSEAPILNADDLSEYVP